MIPKSTLLNAAGFACGLFCALFGVAALAQSAPGGAAASADLAAAVAPTAASDNGVSTLCGGIGVDEAAHMRRSAPDYQLMLTFAETDGAYLADVDVEIADAGGQALLHTSCDAPILLVNFPNSGSYRITASVADHAITRLVRVPARRAHNALALVWPRRVVEMQAGQSTQG
ncbi:MAG: hypothetical protein V4582_16980 [Pseudomonadota bacterium]